MKSSEVLVAFVCLFALASARPRQHHAGPFHPYFTEPVRYYPDPSAGPWMVPGSSPSARAKALLAKMNLTEKVDMLHGAGEVLVSVSPGACIVFSLPTTLMSLQLGRTLATLWAISA